MVWKAELDEVHTREKKFANKWMGPYRVSLANNERSVYKLVELDGTLIQGTFAGRRLKRYFSREAWAERWNGRERRPEPNIWDSTEAPPQLARTSEENLIPSEWRRAVVIPPRVNEEEYTFAPEEEDEDMVPEEWGRAVVIPPRTTDDEYLFIPEE